MAKVRENFNQQNFSVFFLPEFSTAVNKHYLEDFVQPEKAHQLRLLRELDRIAKRRKLGRSYILIS